jgi:hypothetical protein
LIQGTIVEPKGEPFKRFKHINPRDLKDLGEDQKNFMTQGAFYSNINMVAWYSH